MNMNGKHPPYCSPPPATLTLEGAFPWPGKAPPIVFASLEIASPLMTGRLAGTLCGPPAGGVECVRPCEGESPSPLPNRLCTGLADPDLENRCPPLGCAGGPEWEWLKVPRPRGFVNREALGLPDGVGAFVGAWIDASSPDSFCASVGASAPRLSAVGVSSATDAGTDLSSLSASAGVGVAS